MTERMVETRIENGERITETVKHNGTVVTEHWRKRDLLHPKFLSSTKLFFFLLHSVVSVNFLCLTFSLGETIENHLKLRGESYHSLCYLFFLPVFLYLLDLIWYLVNMEWIVDMSCEVACGGRMFKKSSHVLCKRSYLVLQSRVLFGFTQNFQFHYISWRTPARVTVCGH